MYQQEGYRLMGAAFEVYNQLGYGMAEEIYQESLEIELELRGIPFQAKSELVTYYKGRALLKHYLPDLVVYGGLVVELKAVTELAPEHEAQVFNFGCKRELQWKRFILSDLHQPQSSANTVTLSG